MQARHGSLGMALSALVVLAACASSENPELMNISTGGEGPDEFAIVPTKELEMPPSGSELPEPTPGGSNRADRNPEAEAVAALGGNAAARGGVPAADSAILAHAVRFGRAPDIRRRLAAEDLEYRRDNTGRLLERVFNRNVYYSAYEPMALDKYRELERWRRAGARTPGAPPPESARD